MNGPDLLRKYLTDTRTPQEDFGKRLDVRRETVSRWLSGSLAPSVMARLAIEHLTAGEVPAKKW